ncbi:hypothetical protein DOY81_014690 [Sarcophaga bullata]|nr:hypothetical protein DOY81_014690 [Sarcophaga bullata]
MSLQYLVGGTCWTTLKGYKVHLYCDQPKCQIQHVGLNGPLSSSSHRLVYAPRDIFALPPSYNRELFRKKPFRDHQWQSLGEGAILVKALLETNNAINSLWVKIDLIGMPNERQFYPTGRLFPPRHAQD